MWYNTSMILPWVNPPSAAGESLEWEKNCKKAPKKGIFRHALSYERGAFVQEDECPNLMDTKSDRHEAGFHRGRCFYNKIFHFKAKNSRPNSDNWKNIFIIYDHLPHFGAKIWGKRPAFPFVSKNNFGKFLRIQKIRTRRRFRSFFRGVYVNKSFANILETFS